MTVAPTTLDTRSGFARASASSGVLYVAAAALTFALHVVLSRLMGSHHYGAYVYVVGWLNILLLFGKLGLDTAVVRYVASYAALGEWALLSGILRRSAVLSAAASAVIGCAAAGVVFALNETLSMELIWTFWIGLASLPIVALTHLRQAALRALRRVVLAQVPEFVLRPALLAGLVVVAGYALGSPVSSETAMVLHLVAAGTAFGAGSILLLRALPEKLKRARPSYRDKEWLAAALPLFMISGMQLIHVHTDIVMVGALIGTREAGIYAAASRTGQLVLLGLMAVNVVIAPMISGLYAAGRIDELRRAIARGAMAILAVTPLLAVGLLLFGEQVLSLFGAEFREGYTALTIIVAGQVVNALAGSVALLMTMTRYEREAAAILALSVAVNVSLNVVLIPAFGLAGAATATAVTTTLWNALMILFVRRRLNINPTALGAAW